MLSTQKHRIEQSQCGEWNFHKLTVVNVFAILLENRAWVKYALMPESKTKTSLSKSKITKSLRENATWTLYFFLNFSVCFFTDWAELGNRLQGCSFFPHEKLGNTDPTSFQKVCTNEIPILGSLNLVNNFLHDSDIVDGPIIVYLAGRIVGKNSNVLGLSHQNSLSSKPIAAHRVMLSSAEHHFGASINHL